VSTEISKVRKHAMLLVQTLVQPRVDVQKVKNNFDKIKRKKKKKPIFKP